jgi:hypothetical protein
VTYAGTSGVLQDSANFVFNGTNLGIGVASPAVPLEIDKNNGEALRLAATGGNQTIYSKYVAGSPSIGSFIVGVDSATGGAFSGLGPYGVLWQEGNTGIAFGTNNALAMALTTSGTVILKGGSSSATGTGITFPATQVASTDPNTLDDYEEGTFDAAITMGSGTATVFLPTTGLMRYIKIGRMVTVHGNFNLNPVSSPSGTMSMALPFTSINTGRRSGFASCSITVNNVQVPTNGLCPFGALDSNSSSLFFYWVNSTGGGIINALATLNGDYGVTLTYETAL